LQPVFEIAETCSLNKVNPATRREIFERFGPESGRALFELFFWMFDESCATKVASDSVTCPVLVISGSEDEIVSSTTARRVAALYGENATFVEAEGHGHFLRHRQVVEVEPDEGRADVGIGGISRVTPPAGHLRLRPRSRRPGLGRLGSQQRSSDFGVGGRGWRSGRGWKGSVGPVGVI
jgi:hypothetical protein